MAIRSASGACALGQEILCERYSRGSSADPHVLQTITTALSHRCHPDRFDEFEAPLVWDIGSNVGQFTLIMRAMGCRVFAVEPQPSMNWFHKGSIIANGWYDNGITLIEKGLGETKGIITLTKLWQPG